MFTTLHTPLKMFCPPSIKSNVLVLACDARSCFFILELVMVENSRQYDLLKIEQSCRVVKGSDHPNSILCRAMWQWFL